MRVGSVTDGVWVEEFNTDTGQYTRRSPDGTVLTQRPLTAEESAEFTAQANEAALRTSLGASQVYDNLRTIASGTGQFATATARDAAIRTCARALVILVRLKLRRLEGTD